MNSSTSAKTIPPEPNPYDSRPVECLGEDEQRPEHVESVGREGMRAAVALSDQIVVSAANFLTLAMIANYCTQAEVGLFHLAWTIVGFLRIIQERLLAAPYLVFVHRSDQNARTLLGSSLVHQFIFSLVCALMLVGLAGWFSHSRQVLGMSQLLLVLVVSLPFMLLRDHVRAICSAHFEFHVALLVDVFVGLVQLGGIWWLAETERLSIPAVAVVLGIACLIPSIVWIVLKRRVIQVHSRNVTADWQQNWDYSRWLVGARTVGMAGFYAVPWVVVFIMDEASAGAFATASGLVGLSLMFITGTNSFFQPRTVKAFHDRGVDRMCRTVVEAIVVWGAVLLAIVVFFVLTGGWLLGLIYGPTYAPYGSVVVWLSASMLTVSVSIASGNGLAALGKPKGYFWGELSYCIVSIVSALLLVPVWGLDGAGLALTAGGLAASLVTSLTLLHLVKLERNAHQPLAAG